MAKEATLASNLRWTWGGAMVILSLISLSPMFARAQLRTDFYHDICPNVESLVKNAVAQKFKQTFVTAPGTLRLFFHDCFVRGCDASVLLAGPTGKVEKDHPDDLSLEGDGFDTVVKAKLAVDRDPRCKNKVSCADILALATRDVVSLTGGPFYQVELGRRDGRFSTVASVQHNIPHSNFNLDNLNTMFSSHGLSQTDMIALSGAHTLGFSHCVEFSKRIYNFSVGNPIDPTLNPAYALQLRKTCPINVDPKFMAQFDPTPMIFDNMYFKNLQQGKGLLTSDQALFSDTRSRQTVNLFASSPVAFNQAFIKAITKLGRVGVNTGNVGEIRRDCTIVN